MEKNASRTGALEKPSSPDTALFVYFKAVFLFLAFTHTYNPRHVQVSYGKDTSVYIVVEAALAYHDLINMVNTYVIKRLTFSEKRADYAIKPQSLLFGKLYALAGFRAHFLVFLLSFGC